MQVQPFAEVLDLEEQFYNHGFKQGLADGEATGWIEGRTFGLEKGFEKFTESGRLYGKALIWENRISKSQKIYQDSNKENVDESSTTAWKLRPLPDSQRLSKHLRVLHALVEWETISFDNSDEAVTDFDDRLKRAQATVKIIEKLISGPKGTSDEAQKKVIKTSMKVKDLEEFATALKADD